MRATTEQSTIETAVQNNMIQVSRAWQLHMFTWEYWYDDKQRKLRLARFTELKRETYRRKWNRIALWQLHDQRHNTLSREQVRYDVDARVAALRAWREQITIE